MKVDPKAHEKHPIHRTPFSSPWITAYKTTRITLTGYKQKYKGWAKKVGHRLMTIILSNLNRLKNFTGRFRLSSDIYLTV